jgi:hypothetical protein
MSRDLSVRRYQGRPRSIDILEFVSNCMSKEVTQINDLTYKSFLADNEGLVRSARRVTCTTASAPHPRRRSALCCLLVITTSSSTAFSTPSRSSTPPPFPQCIFVTSCAGTPK